MTNRLWLDDPIAVVYWLFDETCSCPEESGYVGCCTNLARRLVNHRIAFASYKGAIGTPHPNLAVKILLTGTSADALALERELRPRMGIGWNRNRGGRRSGPRDLAHPYIRALEPKTRKGIPQSSETRTKISETNRLHYADPAARNRLSEAVKETWQKRKANHKSGPMHHVGKGIPKSPEHRENMRQAALRRYADPTERERTSKAVKRGLAHIDRSGKNNSRFGKHCSEETKEKLRRRIAERNISGSNNPNFKQGHYC
jgi:NUMOD3 motif